MTKKLTKIQESARNESCDVNIWCDFSGDRTVVLAHNTAYVMNSPRKSDTRACYACMHCHDVLDGRTPYEWKEFEKEAVWNMAIARTHVKLMEKGLLKFEGMENTPPKQLPRRT